MKKILKISLFFLLSVFVALVIFFFGFLKIAPVEHNADAQLVGDMIWYEAPDGGIGFKILESAHPKYRIKITMNSPDEIYYEGKFIYKGSELDKVTLMDLGSYFGEDIDLTNGEKMVPAQ
ncbi:hypothetical protein [Enterovibrio sp. 27052020O]|uniref:hypothetical protein n=1 Tax=Enterovibrio sp. 27052020O TaxID=3241166 RepID=UPI00388D8424